MSPAETETHLQLKFRRPTRRDGVAVYELVDRCKPLDLNSLYSYLLVIDHHAPTCVVAEEDGTLLGFISAYIKPNDPETVFVWQVAVSPDARGRGLGVSMLQEIVDRPECQNVTKMETTITPSNEGSWALFKSFARRRGAQYSEKPYFEIKDFGPHGHESEHLMRIEPLNSGE